MAELLHAVRIDFAALRVYGRDEETQLLETILTRTIKGHPSLGGAQLVEIKGHSGCGKSVLAESLKPKVLALGGFYVVGNYDPDQSLSQSYAVRQALNGLLHGLIEEEDIRIEIKASLLNNLSQEDIAMLSTVLPQLPGVLGGDSDDASLSNNVSSCRPEWIFERIKIAVCKFLECVCRTSRPVVMVIEDIQWSDPAGLELLQAIICSKDVHGLLIICPYRENEVARNDHPAANMLADARRAISPNKSHSMTVGNLKTSHIICLLADLSHRRPGELLSLAGILQARTHGNPFFLIQYLKFLERDELIRRADDGIGWTWSEQDILRNLDVTDNVAAFVSDNIRKLPSSTQKILQLASCFGARFDATLLSHVMKGADVSIAMELAMKEGLVERIASSLYKFTHDRVQQAAYAFATPLEQEVLHYTIGRMIREILVESTDNNAIFIVTDQLNKGQKLIQSREEKRELVVLNLEAAQKAKSSSAFYPAAEYLNMGISMMDRNERWTEENYRLTLDLYALLVEMERCVGHCDACYEAVKQIVLYGRSLHDKIPSLLVQIDALGSQGNAIRAIREATDLMYQLGERFPKNPGKIAIGTEFAKTKVLLRGCSDDDLANRPLVEGEMKIVMELLAMICAFAYHAGMIDHVSMAGFRMMKLSLKHGLYAPFVFSVYGVLSGSIALQTGYMTAYHEASRFGELAIRTLSRFSEASRCRTLIVATLFSMHLKRPFNHCLDHALEAYKSGMQVGDANFSFCSTSGYLYMYLCVGLPLRALLKDCPLYSSQMAEYGSTTYFQHATVLHQFVLNLTGEGQRTTELSGDVMDLNEYIRVSPSLVVEHIRFFQMCLGFYFKDIKQAEEAANTLWKVPRDEETFIAISFLRRLYQGLVYLWLARETGKRKYRRRGRYITKALERIVRAGNINCLHCLLLLKAEGLRNNGRQQPEVVRRAYDNAIASASRGGFTHTSAVAYELASNYFEDQGDDEWTSFYLTKASLRYSEWNAYAKVKSLEQLYPDVVSCEMPLERSIVKSGNYRGQARFNSRPGVVHRGESIRIISDSISMGNSGFSSGDSCISSPASSKEFTLNDVPEQDED